MVSVINWFLSRCAGIGVVAKMTVEENRRVLYYSGKISYTAPINQIDETNVFEVKQGKKSFW